MEREWTQGGKSTRSARLLVLSATLALAVPSAGLALVKSPEARRATIESLALEMFTPASVDPELAARVADKARARGFRFTPAGAATLDRATKRDRVVTVAVRVDGDSAQALMLRKETDLAPGRGTGLAGLQPSRFQLGTAVGYKSFARPPAELSGVSRMAAMPDLAEFEPPRPKSEERPSRLQPRIELEDREIAGRSPNTLDAIGAQTVGVGGSFRLSPRLDVTAGVRYSQERERLDPLTNAVQDSQAVYVGTQFKF